MTKDDLARNIAQALDDRPNVGIEPPYSVGSNDGLGVLVEKRGEL